MNRGPLVQRHRVDELPGHLARTGAFIRSVQLPDGAIPWFAGGIVDPWDHVEAAMGLTIAGHWDDAARAYDWLARTQRPDGAWFAAYQDQAVADATRAESNFVAYAATGLWHHFAVTGDRRFLERLWPTVDRAMAFVLRLQAPTGEIYWALDGKKGVSHDALVTGCSSIHLSLACAGRIAATLGHTRPAWLAARARLGACLRDRPERFDRTWPSKARYSMDWFYPVLTGVVKGAAARERLAARWAEFVEPGLGCRCVADEPWVTVAESCELTMALLAAGERAKAERVFADLAQWQAEDGSWWTGYAFRDQVLWPDERPTWTAGAVLLAADALLSLTPASTLFIQHR